MALGWKLCLWLAAAVLAAGCASADITALAAGETLAALTVIDTRAEHRPLAAELFAEAEDGQVLDAGDTVRTDESGFAEVVYADGSLTRLGSDTVLTVVTLDGDATVPEIDLELDVGRVWNRVNTVTGERGSFEIATDVGTAAVRGTAFAVECTAEPVCTFTVTEGLVVVRTLDGREIEIAAGEVVTLGRDDEASVTTGSGEAEGGGSGGGGDDPGGGTAGGDDTGSGSATTTTGSSGGSGGAGVTVELARSEVADTEAPWAARNQPLDDAVDRFAVAEQRCSVTVAGRNLDHATTPDTAIDAPIDETLSIDAVATGPLDAYAVDLELGGLRLRAAEGEVLPDESGDRTGFRGDIDVGEYAEWGVGLYEVRATTTGTVCSAHAFINVTGRHPLTTGTGLLALLLTIGGLAGLYGAVTLVGPTATATTPTDPPPTDTTTSWWSSLTNWWNP